MGDIHRRPALLVLGLAALATLIIAVHYAIITRASPSPVLETIGPLFHPNAEANLPTWYSTVLWLIAAWYAVEIAAADGERSKFQWRSLAVLFTFLSFDEAAEFHEKIGDLIILLNGGKLSGFLFFEWVIYGAVLVAVLAVVYGRFVIGLGPRLALILVGAGIVYLSGALGLEALQAAVADGSMTVPHALSWRLGILEEYLEMIGVVVLIYGLATEATRRAAVGVRPSRPSVTERPADPRPAETTP